MSVEHDFSATKGIRLSVGDAFAYVLVVAAGLSVGAIIGVVIGLATGLIPFHC